MKRSHIGLGEDVLETKALACLAEGLGTIVRAVVGHDALHFDAEAGIGGGGEGDGTLFSLIAHDAAEGDAGNIVDADMHEFPADAGMAIDNTGAASGDAMPYGADFAELFDVEMDQITRVLALMTTDRLRLQRTQPVQSQPTREAAHGGC